MLVICLLLLALTCLSVLCYVSERDKCYFPDSRASRFLFRFCQRKALEDERKRELPPFLTLVSCGVCGISDSSTTEQYGVGGGDSIGSSDNGSSGSGWCLWTQEQKPVSAGSRAPAQITGLQQPTETLGILCPGLQVTFLHF